MTNFANDLHIEGRIENDLQRASEQLITRHPAALMAAARVARSHEIARLFGLARQAIMAVLRNDKQTTAAAPAVERVAANANKIEKHHLAA